MVGGVGVLLLSVSLVALQSFVITSGSMEGTLLAGDIVLTSRARVGWGLPGMDLPFPRYGAPRRGEVWIFKSESARGAKQVKRLIGVPGDTLTMRDGVVLVNGEELDEPYAEPTSGRGSSRADFAWQRAHLQPGTDPTPYTPTRDHWGPLVVPADAYFALGDNRDQSWDSRHTGLIGRDRLEGRVTLVVFSYGLSTSAEAIPRARGIRWRRIGRRVH